MPAYKKEISAQLAFVHNLLAKHCPFENEELQIKSYSGCVSRGSKVVIGVQLAEKQADVDAVMSKYKQSYLFKFCDTDGQNGHIFLIGKNYSSGPNEYLGIHLVAADKMNEKGSMKQICEPVFTLEETEMAVKMRWTFDTNPFKEVESSIMKRLATHPDKTSWSRALKCLIGPEYLRQTGASGVGRA